MAAARGGGTEHGRRRAGTVLSERLPDYHDSTRQRSGGTVHWKVTRRGLGTPALMLAANLRYQERLAWRKWTKGWSFFFFGRGTSVGDTVGAAARTGGDRDTGTTARARRARSDDRFRSPRDWRADARIF